MAKKKITQSIRGVNWRTILFFVAFTLFIWLTLQLSKVYTYVFTVPIEFNDLPVEVEIEKPKINVVVEMSGFQLIKRFSRTSALQLSIETEQDLNQEHIILDDQTVLPVLKEYFSTKETSIVKFYPKKIAYTRKKTKRVPLIFNDKISYKKGYGSLQGIKYNKKNVQVSAPSFILDTLKHIHTAQINLIQLTESKNGKVKLINPLKDLIDLSEDAVSFDLKVISITEKEIKLPVEVDDLPHQFFVKTFPDHLRIRFQVPLDSYDEIDEKDFTVKIDYNQRIEEQSLLIPRLIKYPENILNPKILPNQIDYLLKEK